MNEPSLWSFISNADIVVKCVLIILLCASVSSWTIILQRWLLLKNTQAKAKRFENNFWSSTELNQLYRQLDNKKQSNTGLANIFYHGFSEFKRLMLKPRIQPESVMASTQRAMRIAQSQEVENLEKHIAFLATVGSISPYVGLFGTVWGIMSAFRALGTVQQATIAMVAPGIAEALIATAIGLFAAIPAVVAYNRFTNQLERITQRYDTFQEELTNLLNRELYQDQHEQA